MTNKNSIKNSDKKSDTVISIRVDSDTKEHAQAIFEELGMDISGAIKIFLKKSLIAREYPLFFIVVPLN